MLWPWCSPYSETTFISISITSAEKRYAQIEKEALAFTWACERLSDYLHDWVNFSHLYRPQAIGPLFSSKKLDELPLRVQRFRLKMMRYNFYYISYSREGISCSRHPISSSSSEAYRGRWGAFVNVIINSFPATEKRLEEIKQHQARDSICLKLMTYCQSEWQRKKTLSPEIRPYHAIAAELSIEDGLLMRSTGRIVIPVSLRSQVLD